MSTRRSQDRVHFVRISLTSHRERLVGREPVSESEKVVVHIRPIPLDDIRTASVLDAALGPT